MKRLILFTTLILLSIVPVRAQMRLIAHVSKASGGFVPEIIIANNENSPQSYTLTPYLQTGSRLGEIQGNLQALETQYRSLDTLFGRDDISHFAVDTPGNVTVSISYEATGGNGSPAHVHESRTQSTYWRLYSGAWDVVWDGFAVINTGSETAQMTMFKVDGAGNTVSVDNSLVNVAPMEKRLFVLGNAFSETDHCHFELISSQPVAMLALRGSKAGSSPSFLWENRAVNMVPQAQQMPMVLPFVEFETVNMTGLDMGNMEIQNLTQVRVDAPGPGHVVVRFDGNCHPSQGDRLVLAASNRPNDYDMNDGNIVVTEATSFSHSRVYPVYDAGSYWYYAEGHVIDQNGDGMVSIYGTFTATFFPAVY